LFGYGNKKTLFSTAHNVGSAAGTHLAPAGVALVAGGGNRTRRALPPGNAVQGHLTTPHTAYPQSTTSTQPEQEVPGGLQMESGANTTRDQSMESQVAEDMLLYGQEFAGYGRNIEADVNIYENRDSSPDSPPSQVCK